MAEPISKSVSTDEHHLVLFVPTIANIEAPTVAELGAAGAVDITYYLTADGWNPGGDQATATDDRHTHPQTFETPGKVSNTLDVVYVINPADPDEDEARLALPDGVEGFIVSRPAVLKETAIAAAQLFDIWEIKGGRPRRVVPEANSQWKNAQKLFVGNTAELVAAVA